MKETRLTIDERTLLIELLTQRLEGYDESLLQDSRDKAGKRRFENFYVKPLVSALDKISNNETAMYSSKEKLACISCINEHYDDFYKELQLPTAFSWLNISDAQAKVVYKLDNCKNILWKCGYYDKEYTRNMHDPDFRYSNVLNAVEKLKTSDKIFLSKVGQNDYYKIAFVYNSREYVPFELKHGVSWKEFQFMSLNGESPDNFGEKKFSMVTTRRQAKELLATCDRKHYPEGVLDFFNILLN